jgi:hypothetical protein
MENSPASEGGSDRGLQLLANGTNRVMNSNVVQQFSSCPLPKFFLHRFDFCIIKKDTTKKAAPDCSGRPLEWYLSRY